MYKVEYYTLAVCANNEVGNIMQYSDTWYTDFDIADISENLQKVIDIRKGKNKYVFVITNIEKIKGHCNR